MRFDYHGLDSEKYNKHWLRLGQNITPILCVWRIQLVRQYSLRLSSVSSNKRADDPYYDLSLQLWLTITEIVSRQRNGSTSRTTNFRNGRAL